MSDKGRRQVRKERGRPGYRGHAATDNSDRREAGTKGPVPSCLLQVQYSSLLALPCSVPYSRHSFPAPGWSPPLLPWLAMAIRPVARSTWYLIRRSIETVTVRESPLTVSMKCACSAWLAETSSVNQTSQRKTSRVPSYYQEDSERKSSERDRGRDRRDGLDGATVGRCRNGGWFGEAEWTMDGHEEQRPGCEWFRCSVARPKAER